jgi:predicted dehydrogenase
MESDKIIFTENEMPMGEFSRTTDQMFGAPKNTVKEITASGHGEQHIGILRNFTEAILEGKPLVAPAAEGIKSVELANAMLLSAFEDRAVELPLDAAAYEKALQKKIANSTRSQKK